MPRTQTERQTIRNEHPDSWIAVNEGDTIMGRLIDVTEAWSNQRRDPQTGQPGSWYPLLTIHATEATGYSPPVELKVHCFGAVLYHEVMRKRPQLGEQIRITYKGAGEARAGQNPPELYVVRGGGPDAADRAYSRIEGGGGSAPPQGGGQQTLDEGEGDIPF